MPYEKCGEAFLGFALIMRGTVEFLINIVWQLKQNIDTSRFSHKFGLFPLIYGHWIVEL